MLLAHWLGRHQAIAEAEMRAYVHRKPVTEQFEESEAIDVLERRFVITKHRRLRGAERRHHPAAPRNRSARLTTGKLPAANTAPASRREPARSYAWVAYAEERFRIVQRQDE